MKMRRLRRVLSLCVTVLAYSTVAEAALLDRGGGLIYDDTLDVTWLFDANYALTNGTDPDATPDGRMILSDANTWVANLSYYDSVRDVTYTDWRLASMDVDLDGTIVDCSAVTAAVCQDNEYGHLYHVDGITAGNPGLFENIQGNVTAGGYWSGTSSGTTSSWAFQFSDGISPSSDGSNLERNNSSLLYPWAVRDGDVSAIPLPATIWLFGSGLIALIAVRRRKLQLPT